MLTKFRVQNFKNLVDTGDNFTPQPLNVIIGPNGSGKSSLLQSIDFLRAFFMSSVELYLQEKDWQFRDLPNLRQPGKVIEWSLSATLGKDGHEISEGIYDYSVRLAPKRYLTIGSEELTYTQPGHGKVILLQRNGRRVTVLNRKTNISEVGNYRVPASVMSTYDPVSDRTKYPEMIHFREWVEKFRYFLFWDTKILRSPDRNKHEELGPSGEHLAPVLALLKQRHPDRFDKLKKRIQRLFPHVADISISGGKTSWGWRTIRIHERDGQKEVAFNSQQTSDGVLRLLAVASLLFLDKVPSLVMFEEPENGMNPQLLREIVSILRELTLKKWPKQCQVIFTTHSPYVLDEFYDYPKEVFIMGRASAKHGATLHSLDSASQLNKVRETFTSLGEAWFSGLFNEGMLGKAG